MLIICSIFVFVFSFIFIRVHGYFAIIFIMIKLFGEKKNMDFSSLEVLFMPPMTDQCDKDFKKKACMFFTVCNKYFR